MQSLNPFTLNCPGFALDPRALIVGIAAALLMDGEPASAVEQRQFCEANILDLDDLLREITSCSRRAAVAA